MIGLYRHLIKLNIFQRRVVAVLVVIVALTGSRVQAADANAMLPVAPEWETGQVELNDASDRGIVVPKSYNGTFTLSANVATARIAYARVTAYASVPGETDDSPFIAADGSDVRKVPNIVATNCLKFGTKIRIPSKFGDRIFVVHDRMNKRYSNCSATELDHVDVWLDVAHLSRAERIAAENKVGNSRLQIEILN